METPTDSQLLQFLYACPVGLIECDAAGEIVMINPHAMQHLLPLAGDRDPSNLFTALGEHGEEIRHIIESFGRALGPICEGHRVAAGLGDGRRATQPKVLAFTIVKLGPNRLMVTLADVSVEVEREQRLSQAEATNQAKSQFMANMSHEIRTPLNGVLGMAQALALDSLAPSQHEKVQTIRDAGRALLVLVNNVLDLSKIEAGQFVLEAAPFDLEEMATTTCAIFAETAKAKGLPVVFTSDVGVSGRWQGDANRCRQIVSNLLANAIKFTPAGEVRVALECSDMGGVRLRVSDTGVGIDGDELPKLFSKFYQVDASSTRRYGGVGLGLSICLELVQLMGGTIAVDSVLGRGSTFTVELPLKFLGVGGGGLQRAISGDVEGAQARAVNTLRVLAAEDNPTNQLVLKTLLEAFDVSIVVVDNGRLAVEAWERGSFDLILMDIQMPELDGVAATRRIRALEVEQGRSRTPIVALTANFMAHQVEEYQLAGMDGLLAKPIQLQELSEALDSARGEGCEEDAEIQTEA